jgi:hypothetical protein
MDARFGRGSVAGVAGVVEWLASSAVAHGKGAKLAQQASKQVSK